LALGAAQGGVFIESMTCLKSGSKSIAVNSRINCCDAEQSSSPTGIYKGCCCLHETTFVEQENDLLHTVPAIAIPVSAIIPATSIVPVEEETKAIVADLRNRPPPAESVQNLYCVYRI
jgi:hypothetical protein